MERRHRDDSDRQRLAPLRRSEDPVAVPAAVAASPLWGDRYLALPLLGGERSPPRPPRPHCCALQ